MSALFDFIKANTRNLGTPMKKWESFIAPLREAHVLVQDRHVVVPSLSEDDGTVGLVCVPQGPVLGEYSATYQLDFFSNREKSEVLLQTFEELEGVFDEAVANDRPIEYTSDPISRRLGFQVFRMRTRVVYLIPLSALKTYQMKRGVQ